MFGYLRDALTCTFPYVIACNPLPYNHSRMGYQSVLLHKLLCRLSPTYLWHLMTAHPSRPTHLLALFPENQTPFSVESWALQIQAYADAEQCRITKVSFNKCTSHKEHEFLLVYYTYSDSSDHSESDGSKGCLLANRSPHERPKRGAARHSSASAGSKNYLNASSPSAANDEVTVSPRESDITLRDAVGLYDSMGDMIFQEPLSPTVVDFTLLLMATNVLSPMYNLMETQCYWFAGTMWLVLHKQFNGTVAAGPTMQHASTYKGIQVANPNKKIEDVLKKYIELRDIDKRERQRRKAEDAQKTEEVRG